MSDQWRDVFRHSQDPATAAFAITAGPDEFTQPTRGIHCNTDGTITGMMLDGQTVTFTLKAGFLYPYRMRKITAATASVTGVF